MTATAKFPVIQRPWAGYTDPGLPVGMWIAQGAILGDVSGGNMNVIFVFKAEAEPLGARLYNIEQVESHSTDASLSNGSINLVNFDIVSDVGLITREIHMAYQTDSNTTASLITGSTRLPIFMGRPQLVDLETQILAKTSNVDGETFFFTAQGYIWEPRSLLVEGGLRRPLDSLYGR